jgi:hypothetical protein
MPRWKKPAGGHICHDCGSDGQMTRFKNKWLCRDCLCPEPDAEYMEYERYMASTSSSPMARQLDEGDAKIIGVHELRKMLTKKMEELGLNFSTNPNDMFWTSTAAAEMLDNQSNK